MKTKVVAAEQVPARPRLLFTGGGGAGTEALARLLTPGYEVFFADADVAAKPYPIAAGRWLQIPMAREADFTSDLIKLCRKFNIDLLIPGVDEELLPVARMCKSPGLTVLLPPEHFVARHLDKLDSNRFLHEAGLPAPASMGADQGRVDFPCIVKPRNGRGSRNVIAANSEAELQAQITLARLAPRDFMVQELMSGQEYTVMVVADKLGELRAIVPVLVERKRGITLRAVTSCDQQVMDACRAIHAADPVCGCYNIQLIKAADGTVMPFEINPRISTTACLGLAAGVDFVGIYLGLPGSMKNMRQGLVDFKSHLRLNRSWHNEITGPVAG